MTLELRLSRALEDRLAAEASITGMTVEAFVLALLERTLPIADHNPALSDQLRSWLSSADTEQKESGTLDTTEGTGNRARDRAAASGNAGRRLRGVNV